MRIAGSTFKTPACCQSAFPPPSSPSSSRSTPHRPHRRQTYPAAPIADLSSRRLSPENRFLSCASVARTTHCQIVLETDFSPYTASRNRAEPTAVAAAAQAISCSLVKALTHATENEALQPASTVPPSAAVTLLGLHRILGLLDSSIARDVDKDLAIENCKRILTSRSDVDKVNNIAHSLRVPAIFPAMAGRFPVLSTSDLPLITPEEQSATASPARGSAMLNSIFKSVRIPEFRHKWMFWAEKGQQATPKEKSAQSEEYASRPKPLGDQIVSIKEFYQHFNNIPVESLKLRDSIHLFHMGIKPLWEDPRNTRGGAWYFKISKDVAAQFWHEMCLLAVGDGLQGAVETKRASFNDDICGISYSVRWNAVQIAVWNRDAENEAGKEKLLKTILDKLSEELVPKKEDSYWYKAHKEHKGFIEQ